MEELIKQVVHITMVMLANVTTDMKYLIFILTASLIGCGTAPATTKQALPRGYELVGSYVQRDCPANYPTELTLDGSTATLNYANQGDTRTFSYIAGYTSGELSTIELDHATGYCGVAYDATCGTTYTQIVVFTTFYQDLGILGFGSCTYQHQ